MHVISAFKYRVQQSFHPSGQRGRLLMKPNHLLSYDFSGF